MSEYIGWIVLASLLSPFLLYLFVRIVTSAAFRSWWEAKHEFEKKEK
jgi:hypothetical protein